MMSATLYHVGPTMGGIMTLQHINHRTGEASCADNLDVWEVNTLQHINLRPSI